MGRKMENKKIQSDALEENHKLHENEDVLSGAINNSSNEDGKRKQLGDEQIALNTELANDNNGCNEKNNIDQHTDSKAILENDLHNNSAEGYKEPKKRGRKPKQSFQHTDSKPILENDLHNNSAEGYKEPKKRGRKSKQSLNLDNTRHNLSLSSELENNDINDVNLINNMRIDKKVWENTAVTNSDDSIVTPKKRGRGRPRKSEVVPQESELELGNNKINNIHGENRTVENPESEPEPVFSSSKRGRKRKEINYFQLENSDIEMEHVNKKFRTSKKAEIEDADYNNKQSTNDSFEEEKSLNSKCVNRRAIDCEQNEIIKDQADLNNLRDEQSINNSVEEQKSNGKYTWTGVTTHTKDQLFDLMQGKDINNSSPDPLSGKKKRGRPKKYIDIEEEGSTVCMICNESVQNIDWLKHKSSKHYDLAWRKGDTPLPINDETFVLTTLVQWKRSNGKFKCKNCSFTSNSSKVFYEHLEVCNGVVNANGSVTCAVCHTSVPKTRWAHHKYRRHNNLAWREGEPPLDLQDKDFVFRTLTALYKEKKPLYCEQCDQAKKSVVGFMSHKLTCRKSAAEMDSIKVACHICGKKILPVSMSFHLKIHSKSEEPIEDSFSSIDGINMNQLIEPGSKRKAAREALQMISQLKGDNVEENKFYTAQTDFQEKFIKDYFNKQLLESSKIACFFPKCDTFYESMNNVLEHLNVCDKKPLEYYVCKLCVTLCTNEPDIVDHLKTEHKTSLKVELDDDFKSDNVVDEHEDEVIENHQRELKKIRSVLKSKAAIQVFVKPMFLIYPITESASNLLYQQAFVWMKEFCKENYSSLALHNALRNKNACKLVDSELLDAYLPDNHVSCDVTVKLLHPKQNDYKGCEMDFIKMELFQVKEFNDNHAIYCGGPINSIAWLPTDQDKDGNHDQILAVSILNSMDTEYDSNKIYRDPCLIQFWNFGKLKVQQQAKEEPYFMSGLAANVGPIWHMEWCPSGCLDCVDDGPRLGLLAVAASDSFVYIYCIDRVNNDDRGLIRRGEPVVRLQLNEDSEALDKRPYYATKISWSKAAGHNYVAVGYSNGLVGLYNLNIESSVLKKEDSSDETTILSYLSFQAHVSVITVISLNHLNGGNRWLCTASSDRYLSYWDLYKKLKINTVKKSGITEGTWMSLWPCTVFAEGESRLSGFPPIHTYIKTLRDALTETETLTTASSGISGLSFSDWLNAVLHCTKTGEVVVQFNQRLFYKIDSKKRHYAKFVLSKTKLVRKDEPKTEPVCDIDTYSEAVEKYGLVFLDYKFDTEITCRKSCQKGGLSHIKFSTAKFNQYSLQSINKVQFNPNLGSCNYYVTGYQAGILRLNKINFLKKSLTRYL
ncbi:uncharacterized protein LOC115891333 isoform X2 [Sitophilus oryzae]|uniref:Uncharacterized protein LOC115891333 isoform X2 n=1 Tax=Sitophilus oryzae TaxID=7048 RepID=A0A6J2YXS9_SITOR|nr:uncharacterized protein LOC115891333 isoform X2 [Sitophilus oryzae]